MGRRVDRDPGARYIGSIRRCSADPDCVASQS